MRLIKQGDEWVPLTEAHVKAFGLGRHLARLDRPQRMSRVGKRGLGDWIEAVLRPAAKLLDRVWGTKLAKCQACARRKAWFNGLLRRR